jgi:hypothetical protein
VRDIAIFGMPSLYCFLLLGGTASAGAHDVKEASEEDCLDVCGEFYIFMFPCYSSNALNFWIFFLVLSTLIIPALFCEDLDCFFSIVRVFETIPFQVL